MELRDAENNILSTSLARAQGEWMKSEPVPFEIYLEFRNTKKQKAYLKNKPLFFSLVLRFFKKSVK